MNIVVCVKQVPNTSEVKIDAETNNLIREGTPSIINPYDEYAVEEALRLKEAHGGSIVAVSMGPPQAESALQECLDMGVDKAVLLSDKSLAGSDTLATGYALSGFIRTCAPDIVLCGLEAIDGCTGQVGPIIAENLGFTQFTYVSKLNVKDDYATVHREMKEGFEVLKCKLPVVVCVLKGINQPRMLHKSTKRVQVLKPGTIGLEEQRTGIKGSPTRVVKINVSGKSDTSYVKIDSSLPAEERIMAIMNGGLKVKIIALKRGAPLDMAKLIFEDEDFQALLP
ncbi:MAG: electron transfer flavoprotein subunit beta/FixA family protein [Oscillospiraceae bacterium]|nr:electron transfer flavoprotein subunit beta/FixA family protein [Oscillospiraceae bacterium]